MPWSYNDAEINGIIDSGLKSSPPSPPMINTASAVRSLLKAMWAAIRAQVSSAVDSVDATNNSLVERSLNLNAHVYLDGAVGSDTNLGLGPGPGAIKTLNRVAQLHNGKTNNLTIWISGTVVVDSDLTLSCNCIIFILHKDAKIFFAKKPQNNANYILYLNVFSCQFASNGSDKGVLQAEAHGGNLLSEPSWEYFNRQGCIRLRKNHANHWMIGNRLQVIEAFGVRLEIGSNATLFCGNENGGSSYDLFARSSYLFCPISGVDLVLGSNSRLAANFEGGNSYPRKYTPISSTDGGVREGELVADSSFLYIKQTGNIKKVALTSF